MAKQLNWTFDEILLVAALGEKENWKNLPRNHPEVQNISRILKAAPIYPLEDRPASFRNVDGVLLKYSNLQTHQPGYLKAQTRGGKTDKQVIRYVLEDPAKALKEASRVRELLENKKYLPVFVEDDPVDISVYEGRQMLVQHFRRERSPLLRKKKIQQAKSHQLPIACEACHFDFGDFYGPRGQDFIEVHHTLPLYLASEQRSTRLTDLAMLCANCHRIVHHGNFIGIPELQDLVKEFGHAG